MSKPLNLGCGNYKKEGYINVDWIEDGDVDVQHDLNNIPYPFEDNQFELVEMSHALEHLDRPFHVLKEIHRICKPNATVIIRVPHFSRGMTHAEHVHCFDITLPLYFNPVFDSYQGKEYKLTKLEMSWFAQPALKKKYLPAWAYYSGLWLGYVLSFFANLSPVFCSRIWCFWFAGFEEIRYDFEVIKDKPEEATTSS
jgi:ubiquinone/menaquinone biosynthesis C-methylase UbiE